MLLVVFGDDGTSDNFRLMCLSPLHTKVTQLSVICPETIYNSHFLVRSLKYFFMMCNGAICVSHFKIPPFGVKCV